MDTMLYVVDDMYYILWTTSVLSTIYTFGGVHNMSSVIHNTILRCCPQYVIHNITLRCCPQYISTVTHRIKHVVHNIKWVRRINCGQQPFWTHIYCGQHRISCGGVHYVYMLWTTYFILWVYVVDVDVVGTYILWVSHICCGDILWVTSAHHISCG